MRQIAEKLAFALLVALSLCLATFGVVMAQQGETFWMVLTTVSIIGLFILLTSEK